MLNFMRTFIALLGQSSTFSSKDGIFQPCPKHMLGEGGRCKGQARGAIGPLSLAVAFPLQLKAGHFS